jgi:hypothetical protein
MCKFDCSVTKRIIRDSFNDRLPPAIKDNHRKIGFVTLIAAWLQGPVFQGIGQMSVEIV